MEEEDNTSDDEVLEDEELSDDNLDALKDEKQNILADVDEEMDWYG